MVPHSSDDIEKLLEIASQPKVKKTKSNPDVDSFISECNVIPGKKKIPAYLIYHRYVLWKKTRVIARTTFFNYFKLKFDRIKINQGTIYLLNPKGFDLSPQGHFKARAFMRTQNEKRQSNKT